MVSKWPLRRTLTSVRAAADILLCKEGGWPSEPSTMAFLSLQSIVCPLKLLGPHTAHQEEKQLYLHQEEITQTTIRLPGPLPCTVINNWSTQKIPLDRSAYIQWFLMVLFKFQKEELGTEELWVSSVVLTFLFIFTSYLSLRRIFHC